MRAREWCAHERSCVRGVLGAVVLVPGAVLPGARLHVRASLRRCVRAACQMEMGIQAREASVRQRLAEVNELTRVSKSGAARGGARLGFIKPRFLLAA